MTLTGLAERIGRAYVAASVLHCARAPGRVAVDVAGLTITSLGLPEPWSTQVLALTDPPDPGAVAEAVEWCAANGLSGLVLVRAADVPRLPGLTLVDELPV